MTNMVNVQLCPIEVVVRVHEEDRISILHVIRGMKLYANISLVALPSAVSVSARDCCFSNYFLCAFLKVVDLPKALPCPTYHHRHVIP